MKDTIQRLLEAMTFNRSHAESKITEVGMPLLEHVIKISLYPNSSYVNGWTKEISKWYTAITRYATSLKKGRSFTVDEVYKFLYAEHYAGNERRLTHLVNTIKYQNDELTAIKYDIDVLDANLQSVYRVFAKHAVADDDWSSFVTDLVNSIKQPV